MNWFVERVKKHVASMLNRATKPNNKKIKTDNSFVQKVDGSATTFSGAVGEILNYVDKHHGCASNEQLKEAVGIDLLDNRNSLFCSQVEETSELSMSAMKGRISVRRNSSKNIVKSFHCDEVEYDFVEEDTTVADRI
jgi:hypothetical protein